MSTEFLDKSGLTYFWGKIKAWCSAAFALIGHVHPASDVTLMTGYSKPSSGSAIAASDTLNQAVGKLEAKVDAYDDSNYVHKTGNEIINGQKTIIGKFIDNNANTGLVFRHTDVVKGVPLESGVYKYWTLSFCDNETQQWIDSSNHGRLGALETQLASANVQTSIVAYKNALNTNIKATLGVEVDANDIPTGKAPSTSTARNYGGDILTRDWIPKDIRIVHTTGNETVDGTKTFTNTIIGDKVGLKFLSSKTSATDSWLESQIAWHDNNDTRVCFIQPDFYNGKNRIQLRTVDTSANPVENHHAILSSDGSFKVDNKQVALDENVVHIAGSETITGSKTFSAKATFTGTSQSSSEIVEVIRCNHSQATVGKYYQPLALYNNTGRSFFIRHFPNGSTSAKALTDFQSLIETSSVAWGGLLSLGIDNNDVSFVSATSTSSSRTSGTDVLTRDWIPKDTRIVHTTGNEEIYGTKTFRSNVYIFREGPGIGLGNSVFTKGTTRSENSYWTISFYDKDGYVNANQVGSIYERIDKNTNDQHLILQLLNASVSASTESTGVELSRSTSGKAFSPTSNNVLSLGQSSYRWSVVYAATGTINTSDERLKSFIAGLPDPVLDCWDGVSFRQFKFNDSVAGKGADRARLHVGLVAQEIDAVFAGAGLDASAYGLFCHDSWDAEEAVYDDSGNLEKEARLAGDAYSLRYEEALCMEAAYQRRENARLKKRIADLEERLAALELKIA